jgi:lysophospholipase L1-like esterase
MKIKNRFVRLFAVASLFVSFFAAQAELEKKPDDPYFARFVPEKAPAPKTLLLKQGDRIAICGDSITEQKMYSRMIETYLTVCVPELKITARQYGWSGEVAEGFLHRMTNDCLRFKPTVATTCYGMNDFKYRAYDELNAQWYKERYTSVIDSFKAAGTRVVVGSAGCCGKIASWVKSGGTLEDENVSLCKFRNIALGIAENENENFADVFWPMYKAIYFSHQMYGTNFNVCGHDGVHPGWAGHTIMAYAYLKAMGLDGDLGAITVELKSGRATATGGHTAGKFENGEVTVTSARYPFCASGETNRDDSVRAGMTLVPFNQDLNRLRLVVTGGTAQSYDITWGETTRNYDARQLETGINLAADFEKNPFSAAFKKVDDAVGAKQSFETHQIKQIFHGPEGKNMEAAVEKTEAERAPLAAAIQNALVPVTHTIKITPR